MRRTGFFLLALTLTAPVAAAPRKVAPKAAPKPTAEEKLIQNCDAHKFEAVIDVTVDGQPKKSKVKLCGVEGQSDAAWIDTLRDAVRKLEANKDMPASQREQIVTAIKAEIGRLSIVGAPVTAVREAIAQPEAPLSRDYAALPPLPPPVETPPPVPAPAAPVAIPQSQSPVPIQQPLTVSRAPVPTVALPKLNFTCYTPGDLGGEGPCAELDRETLLTVRAKGNVPLGASLHFVRNGDDRGDVDLAPLSGGGSMRVELPRNVCAGFGAGRIELRVVVNGSPASTEGPWPLRCS